MTHIHIIYIANEVKKVRKRLHFKHIYIYNSVLTCRQNIINSSASAQLNATKIAVKKDSDVDVCMIGTKSVKKTSLIGIKFGTRLRIRLGVDIG